MVATVRDIAKRAGVSIATVSRVLNNHPSVNETTRFTVLKAAEDLNYPTDNLRTHPQLSRTVLVITREEDDRSPTNTQSGMREFERTVWGGVHSVLEKQGIATRLQQSRMSINEALQYANDVSVSGLILLGGVVKREFYNELVNNQLPFVVAGAHLGPYQVNAVMADVAHGIAEAVSHLIEHGRQCIALVNGPISTQTSVEKLEGFRLALDLHDVPFEFQSVVTSEFHAEDGYQQTLKLLNQFPDLDAIVYAEDTIAMGGMRALKERKRTIPDDVAVIGFGDYDISRFTDPPSRPFTSICG